jgi:ribonuclease D
MNTNTNINVISDFTSLEQFCLSLKGQPWISLDTEFLREKTYYPKLCLVQIGTPDVAACIDPLSIDDLTPLIELLYDTSIVKVMHAARQDMEIFYQLGGKTLPGPIFDTQIAAPLIGLDEQIGYGNLVKELLDVHLDKSHARADWTRRPLPEKQLQYAADDVIYLSQLYPKLREQLEKLDRLNWLTADFDQLTDPALYENPPEKAWLRVKQAHRLRPQQLSVLQALAAWREETAQQRDMPRNWLCKDDGLIDICRQAPANLQDLGHIRSLNEAFVKRHGTQILSIIDQAKGQEPIPMPGYQRRQKCSAKDSASIDAMQALVSMTAAEFALNPNVLATRKMLEQLFQGELENCVLEQGWRKQVLGNLLHAFLNGEIVLAYKNGELVLYDN